MLKRPIGSLPSLLPQDTVNIKSKTYVLCVQHTEVKSTYAFWITASIPTSKFTHSRQYPAVSLSDPFT